MPRPPSHPHTDGYYVVRNLICFSLLVYAAWTIGMKAHWALALVSAIGAAVMWGITLPAIFVPAGIIGIGIGVVLALVVSRPLGAMVVILGYFVGGGFVAILHEKSRTTPSH